MQFTTLFLEKYADSRKIIRIKLWLQKWRGVCPRGQTHLVIFLQDSSYTIYCYSLISLSTYTHLYILVSSIWCFSSYIKYSQNPSFHSHWFPPFSSCWAKPSYLLTVFHKYCLSLTISQLYPQPILILSPHRDFQNGLSSSQ